MQKTHDIVGTVGEYKTKDGETKKRYVKVGAAFSDDQGRISLKLDAVPCSPEWSGWLSLYDVERDAKPRYRSEQQQQAAPPADDRDEIPF